MEMKSQIYVLILLSRVEEQNLNKSEGLGPLMGPARGPKRPNRAKNDQNLDIF